MENKICFRFATKEEIPLILSLIRQLAEYEELEDEVVATEEDMAEWLFQRKVAETLFILDGETVAGMGLFFHNYSTFLGKGGIYLEDLYILPEFRGKGFGTALLAKICAIAKERGCGRVDWQCLRSNEPGLKFYRSINALFLDEWIPLRLSGDTLMKMAKKTRLDKSAV